MRRLAWSLATAILAVACGSSGGTAPTGQPDREDNAAIERSVGIYSAVVERLVSRDHTFGGRPAPFKVIYIVDHPIEGASDPTHPGGPDAAGERFSEELRARLADGLTDLPPIEFVASRDDVLAPRSDFPRVKGRGAVVTLGPIPAGDERVKVAASLYFSALGATWLTYVVEHSGSSWEVTKTTGPVTIS